jgi:hypothetical protein
MRMSSRNHCSRMETVAVSLGRVMREYTGARIACCTVRRASDESRSPHTESWNSYPI